MKIKITETFDMVPPGENRTEKDEIKFKAGEERDLSDDIARIIIDKGFGIEMKSTPAPVAPKKEKASGPESNPA